MATWQSISCHCEERSFGDVAIYFMSLRGAFFWRRGNLIANCLSGSPRPQGARDDVSGSPHPQGARDDVSGSPHPQGARDDVSGSPHPQGARDDASGSPHPPQC